MRGVYEPWLLGTVTPIPDNRFIHCEIIARVKEGPKSCKLLKFKKMCQAYIIYVLIDIDYAVLSS